MTPLSAFALQHLDSVCVDCLPDRCLTDRPACLLFYNISLMLMILVAILLIRCLRSSPQPPKSAEVASDLGIFQELEGFHYSSRLREGDLHDPS